MRLHRFFTDQPLVPLHEILVADADTIHQWRRVFRLEAGDQIVLFNGTGKEYLSRIVSFGKKDAVVFVAEEKQIAFAPRRELWLLVALLKKDNFEWALQKGTELGVSHFVPLATDRSEKKDFNSERLKKIVIEAAEQSGRGTIPEIHALMAPERAIEEYLMPSVVFEAPAPTTSAASATNSAGAGTSVLPFRREDFDFPQVAAYLGPEGGWSDRELEVFTTKKLPLCSLGEMTLRGETAAAAVATLFLL